MRETAAATEIPEAILRDLRIGARTTPVERSSNGGAGLAA
jgi:hypothetical protein